MEQVFFRLHVRLIRFVSPILPPRTRKVLEKFVFLNATLSLCLLIWLHTTYVNYPQSAESNCLYRELVSKNMTGNVADYDVIKVHISNDWLRQLNQDKYSVDQKRSCRRDVEQRSECKASLGATENRGMRFSSSEKLPLLFDSFISSIGMHIHDSQRSAPRYEPTGRGGGSARLFSVAERLLSSPGPTASTSTTEADDEISDYSTAPQNDDVDTQNVATIGNSDTLHSEANSRGKISPPATPAAETANILLDLFVSQRVYLFSLEKGYLMLHPDERDRHDIRRLDLTIARDSTCFGPPSSAWLVHSLIGYDTVVMNWAISTFGGKGYLYNIYSKELFNLNFAADNVEKTGAAPVSSASTIRNEGEEKASSKGSFYQRTFRWLESLTQRTRGGKLVQFTFSGLRHFIAFKFGVIFSTLFLFFTTTTLVSFTLRETQERMLKFTFLLQHHVSHRIPYAPLVFTHAVESLVFVPIMVGILFFLFEFFSDQLLAFMVLSVVWLSEIFSVISLRTVPSISFFPRAFFFYFSLFHIYFFSFPFGFSYLALFTTVLYIQHSMVYCWNTYEIPALESGLITALTLRVGMGQQVQDLRAGDGTAVAPAALSEIQRIAGQSSGSSEGRSLQSIQVSSPSNLLTAEIPNANSTGLLSVSSTGTAQRRRSSTETDYEHEEHLRESYSRHVELSRRIQQEQLSAMLGIHVPNSSGMSQSSHSNSLPPSPYRSRAGSIFNSTPLSSPRPQYEENRHGHGHGLRSASSDSMQGRGDASLLSYPISFIASLSKGFTWLGMSSGSDSSRDYREMENQSGYEGESDESIRRLHRVSSVDGDTSEEVRGNCGCDEDDSPGTFRSTRAGIISPCATPSRRQISRSGSSKSRDGRNSRKGVTTPVRSPFSNMLSGSHDLGSSFDLTDTDTSNAVRRTAYSPVRSSQSGDSRPGIPGVLDVDDIEPQRVSRSGGKRGREIKNQGQSSGRSEPSKYQHNELMMYNSDIDVTDELLNFGAARVGGVPPTQSLLSFARPVDQSVLGIDGVENVGYWNSRSVAGESPMDDYFLRDRYTSNPVGRESSSSGGSSDPIHTSSSSSSSPDKAAALDNSSSSSSTGIARNNVTGSPHYSKSRPSPLRLPLSYSPERESGTEREGKRESPQRLHENHNHTGHTSPIKQDASLAVAVSESSGKHPYPNPSRSDKGSKKTSRSLRPSKALGTSSSLIDANSGSSDGIESTSRSHLPLHPGPVHGQNQSLQEPVPTTPSLTTETLVLSPARRVPSVNDFGYRRNDFNMFGNDFNEDD